MSKVFNPANMDKLDNPERRKMIPPAAVLEFMELKAGETMMDLGCGPGYFALPALDAVGPSGRVIAVDISPEMLAELKKRAGGAGDTLVLVNSGAERIELPEASADKILMAFVFHEVEDQPGCLEEMRRLLKPGGELTIAEWDKTESPMGPPVAHRIGPGELRDLASAAGFTELREMKINPYQYLRTFA